MNRSEEEDEDEATQDGEGYIPTALSLVLCASCLNILGL